MYKISLSGFVCIFILFISCGQSNTNNNPELNRAEKAAVEQQLNKDEAAMDSLEKTIRAQINSTDTI
ncbi:MAG: hypothetical protein ACK44P_03795 [Bacteroidota bacterium]|jgi:hypothetical protein|nr:hypothetical protein [Sphingobacteriales bacterium]